MKPIAMLAAMAALAGLAGCSYNAESSFLGYRSSISYSTPGAVPPGPPRPYASPSAPAYQPGASCYAPSHYNRWGYWVPGRYRC